MSEAPPTQFSDQLRKIRRGRTKMFIDPSPGFSAGAANFLRSPTKSDLLVVSHPLECSGVEGSALLLRNFTPPARFPSVDLEVALKDDVVRQEQSPVGERS